MIENIKPDSNILAGAEIIGNNIVSALIGRKTCSLDIQFTLSVSFVILDITNQYNVQLDILN